MEQEIKEFLSEPIWVPRPKEATYRIDGPLAYGLELPWIVIIQLLMESGMDPNFGSWN
jgi:hypothetical protein